MNELKNYVPRYIRFGIPDIKIDPVIVYHEIENPVNVLNEKGSVDRVISSRTLVSASDSLGKYKFEDFKLDSLLEQGVPLSVFNVDLSRRSLSEISRLAEKLDNLESYSKYVDAQKSEFNSFFESPKNVEQ